MYNLFWMVGSIGMWVLQPNNVVIATVCINALKHSTIKGKKNIGCVLIVIKWCWNWWAGKLFIGGAVVIKTPDRLVLVFQKLLIYRDFHTQPSLGFTGNGSRKEENVLFDARGWTRPVQKDRKATATQISIRYNQNMRNSISERATHQTLKQMGNRRSANTNFVSIRLPTFWLPFSSLCSLLLAWFVLWMMRLLQLRS